MPGLKEYRDNELQEELRYRREAQAKREFNGKNWPFWFKVDQFKNQELWRGLKGLPNLVEIDESEFCSQSNLLQTSSCYVTQSSIRFLDGVKFERYATVFLRTVGHAMGMGIAFCAVPADPNDWDRSQHNTVPLKLRYWKFCLCNHKYGFGKNVGNCSNDYTCEECGWTYNVDSSG